VAWLLPELDVGVVAALDAGVVAALDAGVVAGVVAALDAGVVAELPLESPEPEEPELAELAPDVFELAEDSEEAAVCTEPGRAKATAPAVSTLATPTPVVAKRTLALPRFLAATALSSLSPLSAFMSPVSGPALHRPCELPLR
jgi:hypothetical protein